MALGVCGAVFYEGVRHADTVHFHTLQARFRDDFQHCRTESAGEHIFLDGYDAARLTRGV